MWEALELGAQAEKPQLPAPGGGAVIPVRAAVEPVSVRTVRPALLRPGSPCRSGIVTTGVLSG